MLKPPASKLASQVSFCRGVLSAANCPIQKVPLEIWEHLCKAPLACFCPTPSLPTVSDAESQHPPVSWGMQLGTGDWKSKGENYFWCRFSLSESCFRGSWYLAERPMQLCVLKWALTSFSLPQSWIKHWFLWMLYRTGDPVIYMTGSITGKGIPSQEPLSFFDYF